MTVTDAGVSYDPYDVEIDRDPYPTWKRLRDEAPLYYNEEHDFYALSRYDDVERALGDWQTYSSAKGSLLELIKSGFPMPPGIFIFEDPPEHDIHRAILRKGFTPRSMSALEPRIRELCAETLDPKVGTGGFDFIADLGAPMPMQVIAELMGIPREDQLAIRHAVDESLAMGPDGKPKLDAGQMAEEMTQIFSKYIDLRADNPTDDLMSDLLHAEFAGVDGQPTKLTRQECLGYINLLTAAGNETTTRLIGWMGKVLADFPEQRQLLVDDPSLIPAAVEEMLRFEAPSPVQARYVTKDVEHHGQVVPAGSCILLLNASANRDERKFADPDVYDVRRVAERNLSFGYSIHFCLGAALARLEGTIALQEVLKRFPTWEVDTANAQQAHTSTVRGWERLPVLVP